MNKHVIRFITTSAVIVAIIFWLRTIIGWFNTEPGYEPLNVFLSAIISSLTAFLGWLNSKKSDETTNLKNIGNLGQPEIYNNDHENNDEYLNNLLKGVRVVIPEEFSYGDEYKYQRGLSQYRSGIRKNIRELKDYIKDGKDLYSQEVLTAKYNYQNFQIEIHRIIKVLNHHNVRTDAEEIDITPFNNLFHQLKLEVTQELKQEGENSSQHYQSSFSCTYSLFVFIVTACVLYFAVTLVSDSSLWEYVHNLVGN